MSVPWFSRIFFVGPCFFSQQAVHFFVFHALFCHRIFRTLRVGNSQNASQHTFGGLLRPSLTFCSPAQKRHFRDTQVIDFPPSPLPTQDTVIHWHSQDAKSGHLPRGSWGRLAGMLLCRYLSMSHRSDDTSSEHSTMDSLTSNSHIAPSHADCSSGSSNSSERGLHSDVDSDDDSVLLMR